MIQRRRFLGAAAGGLLAACSALPDKPVRATLYDFGPETSSEPPANAVNAANPLPLVLGDIESTSALEGTAVLYRLGYANGNELRPYAQARWSAPPPQLVRQRLRRQLGRDRPVLDLTENAALARTGAKVRILRMGLEEFSQLFDSPAQSAGLLRLRVTLLEESAAGERLLAQRSFTLRRPAPSADAAGGVQALAAATDAAADEIAQWLRTVP